MKKIMVLALVSILTMGTAMAQREGKDARRDDRRKEMTERMADGMAKRLKLDKETTVWFKQLYAEYMDTLQNVRMSGRDMREDLKKMTDEEALARLEQTFKNDEQTVQIKRAYCKRFAEKLTGKQLYTVLGGGGIQVNRRQFQGNRQGNFQRGGFPEGPQGGGFGGGFGSDGPGGDL